MIPQEQILAQPIVDVSWMHVAGAAGMLLVAAGMAGWQRTGLARGFLIGGLRTVVQLALVGYVLVYIFSMSRWYLVLAALLVMLLVAADAAAARPGPRTWRLRAIMTGALLVGSGLTLIYVFAVAVRVDPWYDPRYIIPLFGMIVGNAMNGAALAGERLASEMGGRKAEIEAYLALGASPARAAREPVRRALRAALIPTVNSLMVVGIVALPGMMTGQILAGSDPLIAIRYQIVVMFMLTSAVVGSAALVVFWHRRSFFTEAEQLIS